MTTRFGSVLAVARLALITVAMTACGTASGYLTPSESTTTLMLGWEHWFTLDWSVEPEPGGANRVRGYVTNEYGSPAESVRLLTQALDPSGAVVGQRIAWVPGGVGGFGRAYFEFPHLPAADHYRVSVWDFSFVESASLTR
jgi:hypothetical protein